jgi:sulfhydrogenase subunit beta (sulfur reductase)
VTSVRAGVLATTTLTPLIEVLRAEGRRVVGPQLRDGAIVYAELASADALPRGWRDVQAPGRAGLEPRDDEAIFGFALGANGWKPELFPPRQRLWEAVSDGDASFHVVEAPPPDQPLAFVGVRPCELAAIAVQDRVFLHGLAEDRVYAGHRRDLVLVAVECHAPSAACFCTSMGTGPGVDVTANGDRAVGNGDGRDRGDTADGDGAATVSAAGAPTHPTTPPLATPDLIVTELLDGEHRLLVRAPTATGASLLGALDHREVTAADLEARAASLERAAASIDRQLELDGVRELLLGNLSHPRWDDVAQRCLACTNCTLVCPTCFCSTTEDTTDLTGEHAYHDRRWDSCFTLEFTHTGPASVRTSTRSRYRQWLTHKLATWVDQFDSSGCVGCGRCITWCPVGIDLTEEVAAIRATDGREVTT